MAGRWCSRCQDRHRWCAICHNTHTTTQLCDRCRADPANRDWIEQDEAVSSDNIEAVRGACHMAEMQGQRPLREPATREKQILALAHGARVKIGVRRYRAPRHHEIAAAVGCSERYVGKVLQKILK